MPVADLVRGTSWLDLHQAGIYTSCKASTIRRACNRQELQHVRIGHARGPILTQAEWLDAWIMRGMQYPALDDADGSDTVHEIVGGLGTHAEMTIDDAINVSRVIGDWRGDDADAEVRQLAVAARRLARHVDEDSLELERESAHRHGLGSRDA